MLFGRGPFMNAKHWRGVSNEIIFDRLAHWAQVRPDDIRVSTLPLLRSARRVADYRVLAPSFDFKAKYPDWPSKGRPIVT